MPEFEKFDLEEILEMAGQKISFSRNQFPALAESLKINGIQEYLISSNEDGLFLLCTRIPPYLFEKLYRDFEVLVLGGF